MKSIIKLSFISVFALLVMFSCKNEDLGTAPLPVSDVTAEKVPGGVVLKWKNPVEDKNFEYVRIEYNIAGKENLQVASKYSADGDGYSTLEIDGFPNTDTYTFNLLASNNKGATAAPVSITAAPDSPIFEIITPTIQVKESKNAFIVTWTNEYEKQVIVEISYARQDGTGSQVLNIPSSVKEGRHQVNFSKENAGVLYDVVVVVKDRFLNPGSPALFTVKPIKAEMTQIPVTGWSFPGYDATSADGKIGYSSQQVTGEGDAPKGRVMAMLDGDKETFWHARYSSPASDYPHFFIIDFGKDIEFSRIGLTGRQSDHRKKAQKGQSFYTCSEANAVNPTDTTTWVWDEPHGFFTFDVESAAEQQYDITLVHPVRYLKVYFGTEAKGEEKYAMMSEVVLYELQEVE